MTEPRGRVHPEQMTLLSASGLYFVVGTNHRVEDKPIFVFGRTLPMGQAVPRGLLQRDPDEYKAKAWEHTQKVAGLHIYARTYSEIVPHGIDQYVHIGKCWPIPVSLFRAAGAVGFDFTRTDAPLEELAEVIRTITEKTGGITGGN